MKSIILITITILLAGCGSFYYKTVKVDKVKVTIYENKKLDEKVFFLHIGIVNSALGLLEANPEEKRALEKVFHEEAMLLCQSENYTASSILKIIRDVVPGNVLYTYDVRYDVASNITCE